MKRNNSETEPHAYGILAGLSFLLFVAIMVTCCSSCIRFVPPTTKPITDHDTATVKIETWCAANDGITYVYAGSGVVLGGKRVLTANHVVSCEGPVTFKVVLFDGRRVNGVLEKAWRDRDIAKLVLDVDTKQPLLQIAQPTDSDFVCVASAIPEREENCGAVQYLYSNKICESASRSGSTWCYDVMALLTMVPGNSGSGAYNDRGQLVALGTGSGFPFAYLTMLSDIEQELIK